jgi:hypothetical protein
MFMHINPYALHTHTYTHCIHTLLTPALMRLRVVLSTIAVAPRTSTTPSHRPVFLKGEIEDR